MSSLETQDTSQNTVLQTKFFLCVSFTLCVNLPDTTKTFQLREHSWSTKAYTKDKSCTIQNCFEDRSLYLIWKYLLICGSALDVKSYIQNSTAHHHYLRIISLYSLMITLHLYHLLPFISVHSEFSLSIALFLSHLKIHWKCWIPTSSLPLCYPWIHHLFPTCHFRDVLIIPCL